LPKLKISKTAPADARADALIVFIAATASGWQLVSDDLDPGLAAQLITVSRPLLPEPAPGRVPTSIPPATPVVLSTVTGVTAPVIVLAPTQTTTEGIRRAAGAAVRSLPSGRSVAVAGPGDDESAVAAVEGVALGSYRYSAYRQPATPPVDTITLCRSNGVTAHLRKQMKRSQVVTDAVCAARDLVNASPSDLGPADFAGLVTSVAADKPVTVEILDEKKLRRGGYGGIIAVGQGSQRPPRLVRMTYRPKNARTHLALVGKGITFDSGGLSLKTPTGMVTMKCDMAGAAAVARATLAIAELGIPVSVTSYLALAENMPSGTAQRPGDVITMLSGRTVEVLNTDAEGRLVMADALTATANDNPDLVVDVATLTGAQIVALGHEVGAAMGNDDGARDAVLAAAARAGEALWPMPLPPGLRPSLDSKIADIANIGDRMGGMLTAGLFLAEFAPADVPWVHLDIAGPAFNESDARDYTPPGGTGAMVRTLIALAEDLTAN